MQISENLRKMIADEFEYVVGKMHASKEPSQKLYFFSAIYGVISRVLNIEYDSTLALIHLVVVTAHSTIDNRYRALGRGEEVGIGMAAGLFDKLTDATKMLGNAIEKNSHPLEALEIIAVIVHSTTGNGYYLYQKGMLKI